MKHPHTLQRSSSVLVIIDMQESFRKVIADFDRITYNLIRLSLTAQMFNIPIIITEQYPAGLGETMRVLQKQFSVIEPVEKVEFSCTDNELFCKKLQKLSASSVIVGGIESHVCVNQTVLGLLEMGYQVHFVADAIGARNEYDHEMAVKKMLQSGAIAATTEMVMMELTQKAGTDAFKQISRMIKTPFIDLGQLERALEGRADPQRVAGGVPQGQSSGVSSAEDQLEQENETSDHAEQQEPSAASASASDAATQEQLEDLQEVDEQKESETPQPVEPTEEHEEHEAIPEQHQVSTQDDSQEAAAETVQAEQDDEKTQVDITEQDPQQDGLSSSEQNQSEDTAAEQTEDDFTTPDDDDLDDLGIEGLEELLNAGEDDESRKD